MNAKILSIYIANDSLEFLGVVCGKRGSAAEQQLNLSSSVNLTIQLSSLVCQKTKLSLTPSEILFCCDILNPGAHLTEFDTPDSVSIVSAMESMRFGLVSAAAENYEHEVEKWSIHAPTFIEKINHMDYLESFVLAIATRQFWSGMEFAEFRSLDKRGGYKEWAEQWGSPEK